MTENFRHRRNIGKGFLLILLAASFAGVFWVGNPGRPLATELYGKRSDVFRFLKNDLRSFSQIEIHGDAGYSTCGGVLVDERLILATDWCRPELTQIDNAKMTAHFKNLSREVSVEVIGYAENHTSEGFQLLSLASRPQGVQPIPLAADVDGRELGLVGVLARVDVSLLETECRQISDREGRTSGDVRCKASPDFPSLTRSDADFIFSRSGHALIGVIDPTGLMVPLARIKRGSAALTLVSAKTDVDLKLQQLEPGDAASEAVCTGPIGPGLCSAIKAYIHEREVGQASAVKDGYATHPLPVIGTDPRLGPICEGPFGEQPCKAIQDYLGMLARGEDASPAVAPHVDMGTVNNAYGALCDGSGRLLPCDLAQQHSLDRTLGLARDQPGSELDALDPASTALGCAHRAGFDVRVFADCVGGKIILSSANQAVLDCAVSSQDAKIFSECAAPLVGVNISKQGSIVARCAARAARTDGEFIDCASDALTNRVLTPDQVEVLHCARDSEGLETFSTCAAAHILGKKATAAERVAIQCAAESADLQSAAVCAGANMFALKLNPEQSIAVQCVVSTGGQPYAAAGCIATRLTARELLKCVTDGFGKHGCFGDSNDLVGKNGWTARTLAMLAGGQNSVIRNPSQIWGGDNSFIRNPGQIWGGSKSFVHDPAQIWGGDNSVFRNPSQLAPKPVTLGNVGGKRICLPWC